jgi:hypothetical protein
LAKGRVLGRVRVGYGEGSVGVGDGYGLVRMGFGRVGKCRCAAKEGGVLLKRV